MVGRVGPHGAELPQPEGRHRVAHALRHVEDRAAVQDQDQRADHDHGKDDRRQNQKGQHNIEKALAPRHGKRTVVAAPGPCR